MHTRKNAAFSLIMYNERVGQFAVDVLRRATADAHVAVHLRHVQRQLAAPAHCANHSRRCVALQYRRGAAPPRDNAGQPSHVRARPQRRARPAHDRGMVPDARPRRKRSTSVLWLLRVGQGMSAPCAPLAHTRALHPAGQFRGLLHEACGAPFLGAPPGVY